MTALLAEFDCLGAVGAPGVASSRLSRCTDDPPVVLALHDFRVLLREVLSRRLRHRPVIADWRALLDHLHADMAHSSVERFRVVHLDVRNHLIRDELMCRGTIDQAFVHVREVIARALELGSASLILVHNHPSGVTSPSRADIDVTRAIVAAGRPMGISVLDHVIVGAEGHTSLRANGLL